MKYQLLYLLIFINAISCSPTVLNHRSNVEPGVTTEDTLIANEGNPISAEASVIREDASFYRYPNDKAYEVTDGVVTAVYQKPTIESDESKLQYWLQKWKDEKITISIVEDSKDHHGQVDRMYSISTGEAVIYSEALGRVTLVVRNESSI